MNTNNLLPFDGEIYYEPHFFDTDEAKELFEALKKNIAWRQEPVIIMGKEIMQPRLTAWYGDEDKSYSYTGITMHPLPWTKELTLIKERIERITGHDFNSALLNQYRDGNDSIGWHRDNEKSLGINPVIASMSFGSERKFKLKHAKDKNAKAEVMVQSGSLLLMKGETQHHWYHSVPKELKVTETRINITFRKII